MFLEKLDVLLRHGIWISPWSGMLLAVLGGDIGLHVCRVLLWSRGSCLAAGKDSHPCPVKLPSEHQRTLVVAQRGFQMSRVHLCPKELALLQDDGVEQVQE